MSQLHIYMNADFRHILNTHSGCDADLQLITGRGHIPPKEDISTTLHIMNKALGSCGALSFKYQLVLCCLSSEVLSQIMATILN